ncbi:Dcp1p-Dcp2p decapping enzyme complex alpha subunit [Mortierella sp. AM989]|nr:Dcp1p-Dcp2p decapping enzyme complex alpha subunit [Mortierella sp. AM989]
MVTRNNIQRPKFNLQKLGRVRKQALKSNATSYKSVVSTSVQHVKRISKKKAQQKGKLLKYVMDSALVKAGGVREATMKEAPIQNEEVTVKKAVPFGPGTTLGAPSGAQPVSFTRATLNELRSENYFVSEKSDGVRVLLFCVLLDNGHQQVFLVDRKNKFYHVPQLLFPVANEHRVLHNDTIVDGELVTDQEPNGQLLVRYLAFDLLAYRGMSIIDKPLTSRLGRLDSEFVKPYRSMLQKANPEFIKSQPFKVSLKEMNLSYGIEKMFKEVIPRLKHGSDGLIFTSSVAPYLLSTNPKMLKWKPPSENTIDFKLSLNFPVQNGVQDNSKKPQFILNEWQGGQQYQPFGQMTVDDGLWEQWRAASTQLHGRVVEVSFSPSDRSWRFFRFRDDKDHGNHSSVVRKVVQSIQDGVEADESNHVRSLAHIHRVICTVHHWLHLGKPLARPARDIFGVASPKMDSIYRIGQGIHVKASIVNGTSGYLYMANPNITISLQKNIPYPQLNVVVGTMSAHTLYKSGFKFKVQEEYLIKKQANIPFRVRASFKAADRGSSLSSEDIMRSSALLQNKDSH